MSAKTAERLTAARAERDEAYRAYTMAYRAWKEADRALAEAARAWNKADLLVLALEAEP